MEFVYYTLMNDEGKYLNGDNTSCGSRPAIRLATKMNNHSKSCHFTEITETVIKELDIDDMKDYKCNIDEFLIIYSKERDRFYSKEDKECIKKSAVRATRFLTGNNLLKHYKGNKENIVILVVKIISKKKVN